MTLRTRDQDLPPPPVPPPPPVFFTSTTSTVNPPQLPQVPVLSLAVGSLSESLASIPVSASLPPTHSPSGFPSTPKFDRMSTAEVVVESVYVDDLGNAKCLLCDYVYDQALRPVQKMDVRFHLRKCQLNLSHLPGRLTPSFLEELNPLHVACLRASSSSSSSSSSSCSSMSSSSVAGISAPLSSSSLQDDVDRVPGDPSVTTKSVPGDRVPCDPSVAPVTPVPSLTSSSPCSCEAVILVFQPVPQPNHLDFCGRERILLTIDLGWWKKSNFVSNKSTFVSNKSIFVSPVSQSAKAE